MNARWQTIILISLILVSFALTEFHFGTASSNSEEIRPAGAGTAQIAPPTSFFDRASLLSNVSDSVPQGPVRHWDVLDPKINSQVVMIQSIDDYYPFLNYNTYTAWPMASLTKLLTAVIVLENIGNTKKIPVSATAVATEGEAGGLKSGEVYAAQDLLKIMLMTSSNDAAAAFAEYLGTEQFVKLMNQKAQALGMSQTRVYDSSGLNDSNMSSASDLMRLTRYILANHPEIFTWTRLINFLAQPINDTRTRNLQNIDPLVEQPDFLGGKTGTSEKAKENILTILNHNHHRLAVIILGSTDRYGEIDTLLNWLDKAYTY